MVSNPIECYEAIGSALSYAAKEPWDRIVLDATLNGVRVDIVVRYWRDDKSEAAGFLTGISRLASFIFDLARLVSTEEKGLFKKCVLILQKSGKFNVQFDY